MIGQGWDVNFGDKSDVCLVKILDVVDFYEKGCDHILNIVLVFLPNFFLKDTRETIRTRSFERTNGEKIIFFPQVVE